MGNTFGHLFRITTWGESHGGAVGVVVDGCPPRLPLSPEDIQGDLDRRRPGQSRITTQRQEEDLVEILSGVFEGQTLGTPILMLARNKDTRSKDYDEMREKYRPSHADYSYQAKYGIRNWQGGGRASARETWGRVAAGAVARKILRERCGTEIIAYVKQVKDLAAEVDPSSVTSDQVESNIARCPDAGVAERMIALIEAARKDGDSLGGVVECVARGVPTGLGEPVFDKLEADLGKGMLSLPACKGFEVGSGFGGILLTGSQHNDPFYNAGGRIRTRTNRSGGIQGGDLQRGRHRPARGVQAHGHDPEVAGDRGCPRPRDDPPGPGSARPVRAPPRRGDGGGHDGAGSGRSLPETEGAVRMRP